MVAGLLRENRGVAAIEMALVAPLLIFMVLNIIDLAYYEAQHMEVKTAAEAAVQAIYSKCSAYPVTSGTNCSSYTNYATAGAQSTTLGANVTLASGTPITEGYYCVNSSGQLDNSSLNQPPNTKPTACPSGDYTGAPGDWVSVQVTFTFHPLFGGGTVASTLSPTINETAWVRVQ